MFLKRPSQSALLLGIVSSSSRSAIPLGSIARFCAPANAQPSADMADSVDRQTVGSGPSLHQQQQQPLSSVVATTEGASSELLLPRENAFPAHFAQSRGPGRPVLELVPARGGELVAGYVLFEETMKKAKVPWLCYEKMTSAERRIYIAHMKAIGHRKLYYKCPDTGMLVKTLSQLLYEAKCCGQGCRHCPYELEACDERMRRSLIWNGAYYV